MYEGLCVPDAARRASLLADPAAPLPALDAVRPLPGAEMLAQRVNGMAVLYPAAARISHPFPQMEEKYAKFAYCSRYAFSAASERLRRPRRTRC